MKKIINIILIILFASLTYAITIETPLPTITISFNEPVILASINATLKDNQNNLFLIENVFTSSDNKTVKYRPIDYLPENNYVFSIKAQDIYNNFGILHTFPFTVNVPPLSITIIAPSFKVSSTAIFNLIIETSLPSECKWSILDDKLYENMGSSFETLEGINHTLLNFDITSLTATSTIYTACKTSYDDSIAYKSFELSVDSTPPIIILISANNVTEEPMEIHVQ